jgi:hypothetical protein
MSFQSFQDFYRYYLEEHSDRMCRRLHFIGTSIAVGLIIAALLSQTWWLALIALIQGYGLAWTGHYFFEHNNPATFKYPWLSFKGDWLLWWHILSGKIDY